jgi:demethylmenaquinone methyltransferase / 2-methoxy-6-polyprenyl-1,4-benzoquinol methylase
MMASARTRHAATLFAGIADGYDRMGALLSFGQDPLWRRMVADEVRQPRGSLVLDVASGTGLVAEQLRRRGYRVLRLDASEPMLRAGQDPSPAILGRAEPLRELARVVRPGGSIVALEFHVPGPAWAVEPWRVYTRRVMPVVGRVVSPAWEHAGRFLGPSIEEHWREHPLDQQLGWWREAGIDGLRWDLHSFGAAIVIRGVRG